MTNTNTETRQDNDREMGKGEKRKDEARQNKIRQDKIWCVCPSELQRFVLYV